MRICHCVLVMACAACLDACTGVTGPPDLHSGTVSDVYVETAPGLFLERRLAEHRDGSRVAVVNLVEVFPDARSTATAWVAPGTAVARGDVVRVQLGRERAYSHGEVIPAEDRILAVLPTHRGVVAITGLDAP